MPYIHEGVTTDLKDIMDTVINFKEKLFANKNNNNSYLDRSSISRASKDLIASFPVLCSDTISPSAASMIAKATERNCVTMFQMLFASAYLQGKSGRDVLAQWHNNLDNDFGMDEFLDVVKTFGENTHLSKSEEAEIMREASIAINDHIRSLNTRYPESSFSATSIECYSIREGRTGEINISMVPLNEAQPFGGNPPFSGKDNGVYDRATDNYISTPDHYRIMQAQQELDRKEKELELKKQEYEDARANNAFRNETERKKMERQLKKDMDDLAMQKANLALAQGKDARDAERLHLDKDKNDRDAARLDLDKARDERDRSRDQVDFFSKQLLDSDVKKFNELTPSLVIIRFDVVNPGQKVDYRVEKQAIIGVKTRLIAVDSFEIINNIRSIEKNKVSLVNLIRATTKEISFARDFVLAIDQAKIDAKQNSVLSKTSPIWRTLQNRSTKSVMNRLRKNKANDASAITTLVLSIEEVNALKKDYQIDITNPAKARYIMEQFNLLSLVIVDEQVEVARFLYDGEKYFQDLAFSVLERETGGGDYKKIINLISKVNRG